MNFKLKIKVYFQVDSSVHENTRNRAKFAVKRAAKEFFARLSSVQSLTDVESFNFTDVRNLKQPHQRLDMT